MQRVPRRRAAIDADVRVGRLGDRHPRRDREGMGRPIDDSHADASATNQITPQSDSRSPLYNRPVDRRAAAFARLFEAVHEGVYIGTIGRGTTATIAVNPHLKLVFGYAAEVTDGEIRPFDADRFFDPQARAALIERLE